MEQKTGKQSPYKMNTYMNSKKLLLILKMVI